MISKRKKEVKNKSRQLHMYMYLIKSFWPLTWLKSFDLSFQCQSMHYFRYICVCECRSNKNFIEDNRLFFLNKFSCYNFVNRQTIVIIENPTKKKKRDLSKLRSVRGDFRNLITSIIGKFCLLTVGALFIFYFFS